MDNKTEQSIIPPTSEKTIHLQSCTKKGINLSLTVQTDVPKHPGRKGGVPSTARRSSPKLAINVVHQLRPENLGLWLT